MYFRVCLLCRTDSTIDGISVYMARKEAGARLAAEQPVEADMVIGVPDSGTTAAIGYAEQPAFPSGRVYKKPICGKNFHTFKSACGNRSQNKAESLRRMVKGKRIVVIDDSIVRGTTSKR